MMEEFTGGKDMDFWSPTCEVKQPGPPLDLFKVEIADRRIQYPFSEAKLSGLKT